MNNPTREELEAEVARLRAALEAAGVGDVGAHRRDLDVEGPGRDGVQDGLQVGAGTGDEGNDAHAPIVG